jgi:hypothetical protein
VLHEHKRRAARENRPEQAVELVRLSPFSLSLGDEDAPYGRVARARDVEPSGYGPEQTPRLRVSKLEAHEQAESEDELAPDRRVESQASSVS